MELPGTTAKKIFSDFREGLRNLYPAREIDRFVGLLFEEWLGWSRLQLHLSLAVPLDGETGDRFARALRDLRTGIPVQYLLGKVHFDGLILKVDSRVLIPRPETEEMCVMIRNELRMLRNEPLSVLDIGTGSGCLAISLAKSFPQAHVTAIDVEPGALVLAAENAAVNQCTVDFLQRDILLTEFVKGGPFHLVVSNPPYIPEMEKKNMQIHVTAFEPAAALFVPDHDPTIFYKAITGLAARQLIPGGWLWMEIHERFGKEVAEIAGSEGLEKVSVLQDLNCKDRFVAARRSPAGVTAGEDTAVPRK
ncbi:MAG TPA: peptide chain release factor N(5)-glutamine methyltransferase [Bacteroidales bacterium]|nr:peptide chain release factor N(5)-glutamine methyltransferase [Bacteroidales bacterium]